MWVTKIEKVARTGNGPLTGPKTLCGRHAMFLLCELIKPPEGVLDIGSSCHFLHELFYVTLSLERQSSN